jgi:hypothetical protein
LTADDFEVIQLGWGKTAAVPSAPTGLRIIP